jgi:hypothetical protein
VNATSNAPSAFIAQAGYAVRKSVRLGLQSGLYTEVLEGLPEGATVILKPQLVREGARVRPISLPGPIPGHATP